MFGVEICQGPNDTVNCFYCYHFVICLTFQAEELAEIENEDAQNAIKVNQSFRLYSQTSVS